MAPKRQTSPITVSVDLVKQTIPKVLAKLSSGGKFNLAAKLFEDMTAAPEIPDFLTLSAYEHID